MRKKMFSPISKMELFSIILLSMLISITCYSQSYDYPVKPGDDAWNKFSSTKEMIQACQIPEDIISDISTEDLLNVCLNYPLLNNYTASNSPYEGLLNIVETFNGLNVFVDRPDSHIVLLKYYSKTNINNILKSQDKGKYTFDLCAIELLLCHDKIINRFNKEKQKSLLNLIMSKYQDKLKFDTYFGFFGKMTTAFTANRYYENVIDKPVEISERYKLFSKRMLMHDLGIVDETLLKLRNYIKK